MTQRIHLYPYRTQKLSSNVPKILVGFPTGKIGRRQIFIYILFTSLLGRCMSLYEQSELQGQYAKRSGAARGERDKEQNIKESKQTKSNIPLQLSWQSARLLTDRSLVRVQQEEPKNVEWKNPFYIFYILIRINNLIWLTAGRSEAFNCDENERCRWQIKRV